jgi:hypothetical protein
LTAKRWLARTTTLYCKVNWPASQDIVPGGQA